MRTTRRSVLVALGAGALAAAGGTLGLGGSRAALGAEKRQLVFAGWQGEDDAAAAAPFLDASKIQVNSSYVASGDELLTKLRSGGLGTIDVVSQNKDYIPLSIRAGLLSPLDLSRIPNAAGVYPVLGHSPWAQAGGKTYAVPLAWGDSPIVWDPKKWDAPPAKYSDLADAKYAGQLVCLDDAYSILWLFSTSLGHSDPSRISQTQLDEVLKLAMAVKRNIVLVGSFGDMTDVLVRGDASMAFAAWELMVGMAADKGKVLKTGLTSADKGFLWADAYSIPVNAPDPDAAYAFINQMLSPASNAILAANTGSGAAVPQAVPLMKPEVRGQYDYATVEGDPNMNPMALGVLPPLEPDGDVVGIAAWRKAWQEFRA